jgi:uncharacterized protein (PEP-CTERM system associated)
MPAMAQDAAVSRSYALVPTFNASAEYLDVRNRAGASQPAELVMQLGPGLQLSKQSGSVQGTLNYQLLGSVHSRRSELNTVENNLSAAGRAELVPGWMYADARATVGRQLVQALGEPGSPNSLFANSNQREVLNLQVSPYARGELLGLADYELRMTAGANDVRGASAGDYTVLGSSLQLSSPRRGTVLGWGMAASQDRLAYKGGRTTDNARLMASVVATPMPDLTLSARVGQESTNVGALERRTYDNWGGSLNWTPSPRTVLSLSGDRRYFGDGFQVAIEHRLRRSALRFTSTRDVSTLDQPQTLLQVYMRQYQSVEPDETLRFLRVLQLLSQTGQNPNAVVGGGFLTTAVTLQRRDELTYSYLLPRTTIAVRALSGTSEPLENLSALPPTTTIKYRGLDVSVSHRLTPVTNVGLYANHQVNSAPGQGDSTLRSVSASVFTALSRHTSVGMGARFGVSSGAAFSTRDTALTASLSVRF